MTDHAFNTAQARYDAAEPDDDELAPTYLIGPILESLLWVSRGARALESYGPVHSLSDRQATAAVWIDGHQYSLTLQREDG